MSNYDPDVRDMVAYSLVQLKHTDPDSEQEQELIDAVRSWCVRAGAWPWEIRNPETFNRIAISAETLDKTYLSETQIERLGELQAQMWELYDPLPDEALLEGQQDDEIELVWAEMVLVNGGDRGFASGDQLRIDKKARAVLRDKKSDETTQPRDGIPAGSAEPSARLAERDASSGRYPEGIQ